MKNIDPYSRKGLAVVNIVLKIDPKRSILLVRKRASPSDPWSFDVGFPGGMVKENENLLQALYRETEEETGIPASMLEVVALVASDRPTIMPGVVIYAFLSILLGSPVDLRPDPSEVSEAIWAPINEIKGPVKMYHPFKKRVIDAYIYSHHIIWGVSKRILESSFSLIKSMRIDRGVYVR